MTYGPACVIFFGNYALRAWTLPRDKHATGIYRIQNLFMSKKEPADKRWLIGITDYVQPPADIEAEAFGDAEFVFLSDWRTDAEWLAGRLVINPHAAYYSERGWYEMRHKAAQTARMYLVDGRLRNQIAE